MRQRLAIREHVRLERRVRGGHLALLEAEALSTMFLPCAVAVALSSAWYA